MIEKIKESEIKEKSMSGLPTRPNSVGLYGEKKMTPQDLKDRMDALALLGVNKVNELINAIRNGDFSHDLQIPSVLGSETNLHDFLTTLKTYLGNGTFASLIKTSVGENAQNVLELLDLLQTHINYSKVETKLKNNILSIRLFDGKNYRQTIEFDITVENERIADSAVTTDKLDNGAVITNKIADNAVTADKIANDILYNLKSAYKSVVYDADTGKLTFTNINNDTYIIDLPLELIVKSGEYYDDEESGKKGIYLTLANGEKIRIPLEDLVSKLIEDVKTIKADIKEAINEQNKTVNAAKQEAEEAAKDAKNAAETAINSTRDGLSVVDGVLCITFIKERENENE